jgi:hypothetical protein
VATPERTSQKAGPKARGGTGAHLSRAVSWKTRNAMCRCQSTPQQGGKSKDVQCHVCLSTGAHLSREVGAEAHGATC